jgi:sugar/nucleoside kinase (ribokinase family)
MPIDILLIGDSTIDLYLKISEKDTFPPINDSGAICFHHGSKVLVEKFEAGVAGNAVNVALGCQKLGIRAGIYTEMGDDQNADLIIETLNKSGVDTSVVNKNKGKDTDVHPIIVYRGERTIFSYHEKFNYKIENWPETKWIYYTSLAENFPDFQQKLVDYVKENNIAVVVNPGTVQMKMGLEALRNILEVAAILILNREEALALTRFDNKASLETLHEGLHRLGPKLTIITDGTNGASASDEMTGNFIKKEIYDNGLPVLDRTGAGDAFSSGFMSAIILNKNLEEAVTWGVVNAGSRVRNIGAINGLLDLKEMEKRVFNYKQREMSK